MRTGPTFSHRVSVGLEAVTGHVEESADLLLDRSSDEPIPQRPGGAPEGEFHGPPDLGVPSIGREFRAELRVHFAPHPMSAEPYPNLARGFDGKVFTGEVERSAKEGDPHGRVAPKVSGIDRLDRVGFEEAIHHSPGVREEPVDSLGRSTESSSAFEAHGGKSIRAARSVAENDPSSAKPRSGTYVAQARSDSRRVLANASLAAL